MNHKRLAVPTDPAESQSWSHDFASRYGLAPFAGGETPGAPAATPAAPAVAPDPGAAATPAPAEGAAPGTGTPDPAAGGGEGAATIPEWAGPLFEKLDAALPGTPAGPTPLEVELGIAPAPEPPAAFDPRTGQPQAPQDPPGFPQYQQPLPGQVPPQYQQPGAPQANGQPAELDVLQRFVDERADERAQALLQPFVQQQRDAARRAEGESLFSDYPELKTPEAQATLMAQSGRWASTIHSNPEMAAEAAREPGFLELVYLAGKQLAVAGGETPVVPGPNGEVPVEQPGGSNPGSPVTDQQQIVDGIKSAGRARGLAGSAFAPQ